MLGSRRGPLAAVSNAAAIWSASCTQALRLTQNSYSAGPEGSQCAIGTLPNAVEVTSTAIEGNRSDIEYLRKVTEVTSSTFGR